MKRLEAEQHYRRLLSLGDRCVPALDRMTDEALVEKVHFLTNALSGAQALRQRAKPGVEMMRSDQARTASSTALFAEWMKDAVNAWEIGRAAVSFRPFHAAVELYGHPLMGLRAAAERFDNETRARMLDEVDKYVDRLGPETRYDEHDAYIDHN